MIKDMYLAHIRSDKTEQSVSDHCRGTADIAGMIMKQINMESAGYLSGLIHDLGKSKEEYRDYLKKAAAGQKVVRGSVNHTFAAVRYLLTSYHDGSDYITDLTAEMIAYAAGAHHGLFDCVDKTRQSGFDKRIEKDDIDYEESIRNYLMGCVNEDEIRKLFDCSLQEVKEVLKDIQNVTEDIESSDLMFYIGMLERVLLSAVIDGDRTDTANFMEGGDYRKIERYADWKSVLDRMEAKLEEFSQDTAILKARKIISDKCRNVANQKSGIFRLNVPTGSGKTLASLRFALAHAEKWNKTRIVFVSPLLSILDQNADVIRKFVQDDSIILEHHSNVVIEDSESEAERLRRECMTENWSSPIIITTMVQLLNTFFEGKTTAIRRFHSLIDAVIIIDEVQTVPSKMLTLFNMAINFLSEICGTTIVLCSATQPCLEETEHPLLKRPLDMVPMEKELWKAFQRTEFIHIGNKTLQDIPEVAADLINQNSSGLIICNKRAEAEYIFTALSSKYEYCYHLSASMCMEHRRNILEEMQNKLNKKVICVSTQVIEAGVDISFGCVIRLLAGMDSVIQAAGRCNRNGKMNGLAPVYLINCLNENLDSLPDIQLGKSASEVLIEEFYQNGEVFKGRLDSDESIEFYYRYLYSQMGKGYQDFLKNDDSIYKLLSDNIDYADYYCEAAGRYQMTQAFKTAGQMFQVFENNKTDVIVPYQKGKAIIAGLCSEKAKYDEAYTRKLLNQAKPYSVSIYEYQKRKLLEEHGLATVCNDIAWVLHGDFYNTNIGLVTEPEENTYLEV